ncbi:acyl carrier protein [Telmatospirillum siberiense]|uniref:Acyl carrier protein n=1 Tax=Telmatospirillum siberiense TaxID=382514 RepID=A0A2N3PYA2_9PROT|nr:acyl carrier protein [Telmatospirillum siberiense]PKU25400.1 acyl carrier protein [Telmatospirillum siberiense]
MANEQNIRERLNRIFQETFDDDSISIHDNMTAEDIDEWDSVSHISLVLAVENEFNIRLSAAAVGKLSNVGEMVRLLTEMSDGQ